MILSFTGARWVAAAADPERVRRNRAAGMGAVSARILASRVEDETDAASWLRPTLEHLHDPRAMRNMDAAVDLVQRAVRDRVKIRIITDYDVDGTTSSLILQAAVRLLDRETALDYHIPNRFGEGYGFSQVAAKKAVSDKVGLVVTADIGVRDHASVALARDGGADVLVCDHHLPAGESVPPDAVVLCPPQDGCAYPNRSLAACGVSLKLANALLGHLPRWALYQASLLKLAAIGTVADMVSLATLENRAIVTLGLQGLNGADQSPGLRALLDAAGLAPGGVRVSDLGFRLGPRINAAGRLSDATLVVELMNARDLDSARALAQKIEGLNAERKSIQGKLQEEALARIAGDPAPFVVVAGAEEEGWHRGVVGIVASKVKDSVNRPVAVVSIQGDHAVGSVRSVPGIHAVQALDSARDLLVKYGGHPMAAGFTVRTADLPELERRLGAFVASAVDVSAWVPTRPIDAEIPIADVGDALFRELDRLGPFGSANATPLLMIPRVRPSRIEVRRTKTDRPYVRFQVTDGRRASDATWWDGAEHADALAQGPVDLLVQLEENVWNGNRSIRLDIRDVRVSPSA